MADVLASKVAFVTGGATGLGRAIVDAFATAGARGVAFDMAAPVQALPQGWRHLAGDVREEANLHTALAAATQELGRLDIVVASAGIVPSWRDSEAIDLAEWDTVFAINVRGVAATVKQAIPFMKPAGGSMIAIASVNALRGHPKQAAYVASEHAVLGIVRAVALDVGRHGVRVNALCPGPVATEALMARLRRRGEQGGLSVADTLRRYGETALERMPTPADVAGADVFLASDLASGVTGQAITVDAGAG
jgi:NAD(P)-dependent dehydrogenase (short-subunit alcohol dehydrogenase family)